MEYFNNELRAQDNCALSASVRVGQQDNKSGKGIFTATGLYSQASKSLCVFCNKKGHAYQNVLVLQTLCPVRSYTSPEREMFHLLRSHSYF